LELYGGIVDNLPIYGLIWYEALVFCNKLSIMEGLSPAYRIAGSTNPDDWGDVPGSTSSNTTYAPWNAVTIVSGSTGYRLPTEAQWEYAAKGGNPLAPGWVGYTYSGSDDADEVAWYNLDRYDAHAVGTKAPNGLGLYDMSGNVSEWCWDRGANYTPEDKTDPTGRDDLETVDYRIVRGGDRLGDSRLLLTTWPEGERQHGSFETGFRLVRPQ
jgi:formylglycine-generating enzyme required for sulfatase activity